MRGIINLVVEIDYDNMITDKNLESILGFTGENDKEGAIKHHMGFIADKLESVLKDKPFIAYELQGKKVEEEEQYQTAPQARVEVGAVPTEWKPYEEIDSPEFLENEEVNAEAVQDAILENKNYMKLLEDALLEVSLQKGFPTHIKVNGDMYNIIRGDVFSKARLDKDVVTYQGFPLTVEGMEEMLIINYKDYASGEEGEHIVKWT